MSDQEITPTVTHDDLVALADVLTKVIDTIDLRSDQRINILRVREYTSVHLRPAEVDALRRLFSATENASADEVAS